MAIETNTFTSYDAVGIREDLANVIYDISPTETPFMNNVGRGKAKNTFFEWQVDSLAAADTGNAHLEGDDIESTGYEAITPTVRLGNRTQISRKTAIVSGTHEVLDKAGRKSEMAYQLAKRMKELKRDIESICLSNQAAVAGTSATPSKTGSLLAFVKTNTSKAADGADPVYTSVPDAARVDGTPRAITETYLKDVMAAAWAEGGSPSILMVGSYNKRAVSAFAGIAEIRTAASTAKQAIIVGAADVYVSDFGNVSVVPNRFQRDRDALLLDPSFISIDYLRPFKTEPMAKTGDAEKRMILAEWGLRVKNEKALGGIFDLTTTG